MTEELSAELPKWDALNVDYIMTGLPCSFVVRIEPSIRLFVDQGADRFGALFAMPGEGLLPSPSSSEICIANVLIDGAHHLEIATSSPELYRDFYLLLGELIHAVVSSGASPVGALESAVQRWRSLVNRAELLGDDRQVGLLGELWVLGRLLPLLGPSAVDAWTGPLGELHDFRLSSCEIEVKANSGSHRRHVVNGFSQLLPTNNAVLFLLSLNFVSGGTGGKTLAEVVAAVHVMLRDHPLEADRFDRALEMVGYFGSDSKRYLRRRRMGLPPLLVAVDDGCPRLTRSALQHVPPAFAVERITQVNYEIDLEGLGALDGDQAFLSVLPRAGGSLDVI